MLSCKKGYVGYASRSATVLVVAFFALAVSGCPLSNWSGPSGSPVAAASTPPPSAPPPVGTPPLAPPPVAPPPSTPPPASSAPTTPAPTVMPTAADATLTTAMGAAKAGVLVGTGTGALTYAIIVPTLSGAAKLINPSTGAFTYAPNPDFSGTDRLQFTVTDSVGTSKPATVSITVSPALLGAPSAPANIGVNVEGVSYYDAAQQYVDVVYMASGWSGAIDANGWPLEDAHIMFLCCINNDGRPADPGVGSPLFGKYQLSFNGIASIYDDGGKVENQSYDAATNTTTATFEQTPLHSDGSSMDMLVYFSKTQRTASSPINTGITNVHLIRPQFAPNGTKWWDSPTQEFTNPFLASLAPFTTLRFMDWTNTNGNQQADWNQITPASWPGRHTIQTDGAWEWSATDKKTELTNNFSSDTGESWQSVIDLGNATGKDIWINIPVRATDAYVKNLATLLKQKLNPALHVYVEYSNEVWNYGFEQWYYNDASTKALLAGDAQAAANYQKNCVGWADDACHFAERLLQISNDFANVWGSSAINAAIRPVFCNQEVGASNTQMALAYINNTYGPPSSYFYGICSAPYWGPASVTAGESTDDLLAASATAIPTWDGYLLPYTAAARYYGLHNFTYEGGTGMNDLNQIDLPNMLAANADPRMGVQVTQALTGAFQNGVDMYMYYASSGGWSKYGMWGATNDVMDLTQPKWHALQALAGQNITRTLSFTAPNPSKGVPYAGTVLPGTVDAGQPLFGVVAGTMRPTYQAAGNCSAAANGLPDVCSLRGGQAQGNGEYGYLVTTPQAGSYVVTLQLDSRNATAAATAQFYVNQTPQGGTITISASAKGTPSAPAAFNVTLPAGVSLLELEAISGNVAINSIVVAAAR